MADGKWVKCPHCNGKGWLMVKDTSWTSIGQMVKQTCEHCKGTGQMWAQK
jgi:DnaJ-class molecular chaperone